MKGLDLFAGIGGITLALERAGVKPIAFCEKETFPRSILQRHWPHTVVYPDVYEMSGDEFSEHIDIISGGVPCQCFSLAGSRKGSDDERFLWPEMHRLVKKLSPRYVVIENVRGLLTIENGQVFAGILSNLDDLGYGVAWVTYSVSDIGGPHGRERVFILAVNKDIPCEPVDSDNLKQELVGWLAHDLWPATPGFYQYSWEPKRLDQGRGGRTSKIKALGNAVVPAQIFPAIASLLVEGNVGDLDLSDLDAPWVHAIEDSRMNDARSNILRACCDVVRGALGRMVKSQETYTRNGPAWMKPAPSFDFRARPLITNFDWPLFGYCVNGNVHSYHFELHAKRTLSRIFHLPPSRLVQSPIIGWLSEAKIDIRSYKDLAKDSVCRSEAEMNIPGMWVSPKMGSDILELRRQAKQLIFDHRAYDRVLETVGSLKPIKLWPTVRSSAVDSTRRPGSGGRVIGEEAMRWGGYQIYGQDITSRTHHPKTNTRWVEAVMGFPKDFVHEQPNE